MQQPTQPQIDFKRFFKQQDIGGRKAAPDFNKDLQKDLDAKSFDKVELVHDKPRLCEHTGHYVQDIVGFQASKDGKGHALFLHYTPEEEEAFKEQLGAMLRQHIKDKKAERTQKEL